MILLECEVQKCRWSIVYEGQKDQLPTEKRLQDMWNYEMITITAEGETFTMVAKHPSYDDDTMSLVLPPKYQGKFPGGGVLFQLTNKNNGLVEIDFIEIHPFP